MPDERQVKIGRGWDPEVQEKRRTTGQRAFSSFKPNAAAEKVVWQEVENLFPYRCDTCMRTIQEGGKRYVAVSLLHAAGHFQQQKPTRTECPSCRSGIDPFKRLTPKLAERKTELD